MDTDSETQKDNLYISLALSGFVVILNIVIFTPVGVDTSYQLCHIMFVPACAIAAIVFGVKAKPPVNPAQRWLTIVLAIIVLITSPVLFVLSAFVQFGFQG